LGKKYVDKGLNRKGSFQNFLLTVAFTMFTASTVYLAPHAEPYMLLRLLSTSILTLFLTGYTFIQLLFPQECGLNHVERLALSFGASLALTPLAGLILNSSPFGITANSALAFQSLLTIIFASAAFMRNHKKEAFRISTCGEESLSFKSLFFPVLAFTLALCLRLYPTLIGGMPFSTDGWPFIRNAEIILEKSPINLGDDTVFDGVANYWPGISLFGAMVSQLTGLSPIRAMAVFLPIAGALTPLIFYALLENLFNSETALTASLIFGSAYTHAFFTAGVTKETYANPLYVSLLLIFLNPKLSGRKTASIAFATFSAALALTHHLTSAIAISILLCITIAQIIAKIRGEAAPAKFSLQLTLILIAAVALYFELYAYKGFVFPTAAELISAASHQVVFFALAAYITFKPHVYSERKALLYTLATAAAASTLAIVTSSVTIMPGFTPAVQRHVLPYILPYFIIMPFITLGYSRLRRINASQAPFFWLATLLALQSYDTFSGQTALNTALWIRTPNFLYLPMALFASAGLTQLFSFEGKRSLRVSGKTAAAVILTAIIAMNAYSLHAAVSLQDKYLGYHWLYRLQEYEAGGWAAAKACSPIAGDMKVYYLAGTYYRLEVNVPEGYRYLAGENDSRPKLLFIYDQMFVNGYVIGFHGVDLPQNWTEKTYQLNHIYSNGVADLYAS
jgi:hypothetical protein